MRKMPTISLDGYVCTEASYRVPCSQLFEMWSPSLRGELLLADCMVPLSVDYSTWPRATQAETHLIHPIGANVNLNGSGIVLQEHAEWVLSRSEPVPVAVYFKADVMYRYGMEINGQVNCVQTPFDSVNSSGYLLGYDVSDWWLQSALTNVPRSQARSDQFLRQEFGQHLNRFHLFDREDLALAFRECSQCDVNEHAPFQCCALVAIRRHDE